MNHEYFMSLAIQEAAKGEGKVSPNPHVGSLLVKNGGVLVSGYHGEMGKLHAERVVFEKVKNEGIQIDGDCVLYVTLEPCCHHGKTPPCTDAILESGVKKVVIAQTDPNPKVSGKGVQILKDAGIEVVEGILEKEAQHQIRFFRYWVVNQFPYLVGKIALSADGFYGQEGKDVLISSSETKQNTRDMRKVFDAILVGKKTLLQDNPNLGSAEKDPLRVILCHTADFSVKDFQAFRDENVIIVCQEKTEACEFDGEVLFFEDLLDLKQKLFDQGVQSVLVEGGGEVLSSFLAENLLDEFHVVQSKNVKLDDGLEFQKLPQDFQKQAEKDFGDDVLEKFIKK